MNNKIVEVDKISKDYMSILHLEMNNSTAHPIRNELNSFLSTYDVERLLDFEFKSRHGSGKEYMILPILLHAIVLEVEKLNCSNPENEKLEKLILQLNFRESLFKGNISSSSFYKFEYLYTICEKADSFNYDISFILGNLRRNSFFRDLNENLIFFSSSFVLRIIDHLQGPNSDQKYDFYLLVVYNELKQKNYQKAFDFAIRYLEKEDRIDAFFEIATKMMQASVIVQLDLKFTKLSELTEEEFFLIRTINNLIKLNEIDENKSFLAELLFTKSQHHFISKREELNNLFFSFILSKGNYKFIDFFEKFQSISKEQYALIVIKLNELGFHTEVKSYAARLNLIDKIHVYSSCLSKSNSFNIYIENELLECIEHVNDYTYFFNFSSHFFTTFWDKVTQEFKEAFYRISKINFIKIKNHSFEEQLLFVSLAIIMDTPSRVFDLMSIMKSSVREKLIVELMKSDLHFDAVYLNYFKSKLVSPKEIAIFNGFLVCKNNNLENQLVFKQKLSKIKDTSKQLNCLFQLIELVSSKKMKQDLINFFIELYLTEITSKVKSLTDFFTIDTYIKKVVNELSDLISSETRSEFCRIIFITCWSKFEEAKLAQIIIELAFDAKDWQIVLREYSKLDRLDKLFLSKKIGASFFKNNQFDYIHKIRPKNYDKEEFYSLIIGVLNDELVIQGADLNVNEINALNVLVDQLNLSKFKKIDENYLDFKINYYLHNEELYKAKELWNFLFISLKNDYDFFSLESVLTVLLKYAKIIVSDNEEFEFINLMKTIIVKVKSDTTKRDLIINFAKAGYVSDAFTTIKSIRESYDYIVIFAELLLTEVILDEKCNNELSWMELNMQLETLPHLEKIEAIAEIILLAHSQGNSLKAKLYEERLFMDLFDVEDNDEFDTCLNNITFCLCSYYTKDQFLKLLPLYQLEMKNLYYKDLAYEITKVNYRESISYFDIIPNEFKERWLLGIYMGLQKNQISNELFSELAMIVLEYPKLSNLFSKLENNCKLLKSV